MSFGQDVKSPKVLVLTPMEFVLHEDLIPETKEFEYTLTDEQVEKCISRNNNDEDRNFVKKMNKIDCEFVKNSDISTTFTAYLSGWLTFKLYGTFNDAIIYPAKGPEKRDLEVYKKLSEEQGVNWIVDIKSVEYTMESKRLKGIAKLELWNKNTNEITLSTEIKIDDENHGGEMSCEEGTLSCLLLNGSVYISFDILKSMYSKEEYSR